MADQQWKRAVAAVVGADNRIRGTAFFVGPDVAMTCNHVLDAAGDGPVRLRSVGGSGLEEVIGDDRDVEHDLALLRVPTRPDRVTLAFDPGWKPGDTVTSHGFGNDHSLATYPDGYPMAPVPISGEATLAHGGREVPALVLHQGDARSGMSGAPVVAVDTGSVLGVVRFAERSSRDAGAAQNTMATPASIVVERWPGLLATVGAVPTFSGSSRVEPPPEIMARTAWRVVDPVALHCVVVGSERLSGAAEREQLAPVMRGVLRSAKEMKEIWPAACTAREGVTTVGGISRTLPDSYAITAAPLARFSVLDAFANDASLDLAVRLLVEADVALFDVTGFEPGVMMLLGVRAATRRGITIASHGDGWMDGVWTKADGSRLDRPFNLSDLALSSHTPPESKAGTDPRIGPLAERIRTGFVQLSRQPLYRDLPVYDALRQLGAADDACNTIGLEREVLVLCSYATSYESTWYGVLAPQLSDTFTDELMMPTAVRRMQDIPTPQVVSQALYERIRRCEGCVADWTLSSPSTFFELGVRMAVSPAGVVQIVDTGWLGPADGPPPLGQLELMRRLLDPIGYRTDDGDLGRRIADQLMRLREKLTAGDGGHRVRRVASEALGAVEERLPDLHRQLAAEADALSTVEVDRDIPQALFYEVRDIKTDRERAALERRLAAWLYLEHRIGAGRLDPTDPRAELWRKLGNDVCNDLYKADDTDMADSIARTLDAADGS